jgi:hypothetical protein
LLDFHLPGARREQIRKVAAAPPKERGLRRTGYTVAGYPFAFFGIPTILHSKKVELAGAKWRETDIDCGGIMKPSKIWVNDLPNGYEIVIGLECQDCKYSDALRFPYSGHKQIFNSTSLRTWKLNEQR